MAMAGGSAITLINALNSKKTVESTKQLNQSIKGINMAAQIGAFTDIKSIFDDLRNSSLILTPFKSMFAQIKAQTTTTSVEAMSAMFKLIQSEGAQKGIKALTDLLNQFNAATTALIEFSVAFEDWYNSKLKKATVDMTDLSAAVMGFNTSAHTAQEGLDNYKDAVHNAAAAFEAERMSFAEGLKYTILVALDEILMHFGINVKAIQDAIAELEKSLLNAQPVAGVYTEGGGRILNDDPSSQGGYN